MHVKTVALGFSLFLKGTGNLTLFKAFRIAITVYAVFYLYPFGKSVYNGCANAVETAGYLVSASAKFTACVKHEENDLKGRSTRLCV